MYTCIIVWLLFSVTGYSFTCHDVNRQKLCDSRSKCILAITSYQGLVLILWPQLNVTSKTQWCTRGRNFRPKTKVFTYRLSVSAAEIKGWIWPNVKFQIFFSKWTVKLENVYIWSSMKEWCFVTKSFLTYCEKKVF